ncbi:MAG: hypothetical protein IJ191_07285 [Treponema sp.]|nr:hypothetical protein [Treponema sp.]
MVDFPQISQTRAIVLPTLCSCIKVEFSIRKISGTCQVTDGSWLSTLIAKSVPIEYTDFSEIVPLGDFRQRTDPTAGDSGAVLIVDFYGERVWL